MSSVAYITIDGYPIHTTTNYFDEWFFKKSERRIVKAKVSDRNPLIWGQTNGDDADDLEDNYVYDSRAHLLKRRLELAGYTRSVLEREFKQAIAERISDAESHDHDLRGDFRHHITILQRTTIDQWLAKLKQVVQQGLLPNDWGDCPTTGDELLDMLIQPLRYNREYGTNIGPTYFPCITLESFARAVLEVVNEDAPCLLDISSLVHGGWTEEFEDLIEQGKDATSFYQVFTEAIADIRKLATALPNNPILLRLLYANAITAMETYLGDTARKQVLNRPPLLRRFVESHPAFRGKKFAHSEVFKVHDLGVCRR